MDNKKIITITYDSDFTIEHPWQEGVDQKLVKQEKDLIKSYNIEIVKYSDVPDDFHCHEITLKGTLEDLRHYAENENDYNLLDALDYKDEDDYEPKLTTDDMAAGQWYEDLNEDNGAFQLSNVVCNALRDNDLEINENESIEEIANKYCQKHFYSDLKDFRLKDDIILGVKKFFGEENESLNEAIDSDLKEQIKAALEEFKAAYDKLNSLLSQLPEEEKEEVVNKLSGISLGHITFSDQISYISNVIKDIEHKLAKQSEGINPKVIAEIDDKVDDIVQLSLDESSFSTFPGMDYRKESRKGLERVMHRLVTEYTDLIRISHDNLPEFYKDLIEKYDLDEENFTIDEYVDLVKKAFKKQYDWLVNINGPLYMKQGKDESEDYQELIIDAWKENGLPM